MQMNFLNDDFIKAAKWMFDKMESGDGSIVVGCHELDNALTIKTMCAAISQGNLRVERNNADPVGKSDDEAGNDEG